MSMWLATMVFGALLTLVGLGGYFGTESKSVTALIPAFFGAPLIVLGMMARKDNLRKHAMHAAAGLGLIGLVGAAVMAGPKLPELVSTGQVIRPNGSDATNAVLMQAVMALLCGLFVVLCVRSFMEARRSRAARGTAPSAIP